MSSVMLHGVEPSDDRIAAEQCLSDTGAAKPCPRCGDRLLRANDEGAEARAYIRAEHLRKAGLRGFDGMTEQEVAGAVRSALDGLPDLCPDCG